MANVYPDDGYPEEGHTVSAVTPVIHLFDLTTMELVAHIDEMDIPGVKAGQRAIISVDALSDAHPNSLGHSSM